MRIYSIFKTVLVTFLSLNLIQCASRQPTQTEDWITKDREKIIETLSSEISLTKDREELQELRKNIPEETQKENDELALITQLMVEPKTNPSRLRQQFQYATQKKRKTFRDKVEKLRKDFKKEERKLRDDFVKTAKLKRKAIDPKALERDEMRERYQELDKERRDFFSEERERRRSFEAEISAQTKDFNDYMRQKSREFSDQIREYTRRYNDLKKAEKEKSKAKANEFDAMKHVPSTPLEP